MTEARERLRSVCAGWNLPLSARQVEQFEIYDRMLEEWNGRMDLTNVLEPAERVDRHYLDSIAPLALGFAPRPGGRILDVGSGAGLPGIPLAILCPECPVCLMDAQQKRVAFLQAVAEACLPNVRTVHARAEDLGREPGWREGFDLVVSRAVAALPVLAEYLLPYVALGGRALAYKGPGVREELGAGRKAAALLGARLGEWVPAELPGRDWAHGLIPLYKERPTPRQYPRRAGMPQRRPLGT